jgi:hypothetical protein
LYWYLYSFWSWGGSYHSPFFHCVLPSFLFCLM